MRSRPDQVEPQDQPFAPILFDAEHQPIQTIEAWERRRKELEAAWRLFLGKIPVPEQPASIEELDSERVAPITPSDYPVVRTKIRIAVEPDRFIGGYLLRPEDPATAGQRPGVVVLHSTVDYTIRQPAGLEGPTEKHIGLHLARRGYVCICPRCFLWEEGGPGEYLDAVEWLRDRYPGATGTELMRFDAQRALEAVAREPDVDSDRLGAIGHSLGGKEVLFLAAFDDRVRATVSSEGGIGVTFSNWDAPWYHGPAIREPGFALDHAQILALIAPRSFLLIGGDSADGARSEPYIDTCQPLWGLYNRPGSLGFYNHRQGHSFPREAQEAAYTWLDRFLMRL